MAGRAGVPADTPAVVLTGKSSLQTAVAALRHGTFDYLTKPCRLVDIQSVQVLRGPQGTLFGKNTTGGALVFTTNKPIEEFEGMAGIAQGHAVLDIVKAASQIPSIALSGGLVSGSVAVAVLSSELSFSTGRRGVTNSPTLASRACSSLAGVVL